MANTTGYQPETPDFKYLHEFIAAALHEDVRGGDHTSLSTIPETATNSARLLVKDSGILAGMDVAEIIFEQVDSRLTMHRLLADGMEINKGDIAFTVEGPARSILTAERLVLNTMQRMSGCATTTWQLARLVADLPVRLLDTRKTTPNFRYFEKWAVRIGGGHNHRYGLFDMIMIKDNHVDYAGGITKAIRAAQNYLREKQLQLAIEVEVRNFDELREALDAGGIQRIMLDNFGVDDLRRGVEIVNKALETEASGGITAQTLRAYGETGVDFISVGALTHSYRSLDLSLKAQRQ
ncbi:MAG: carboxylating nicotinate-nucleotide diphosphorylase [Bacteroidia bacterium]|jgi:nicotinate-nucleotide pyrophosphorylase (carboxylating)|nr:carboxylating nicotinate-nucleotide diphosphorylase [Bacteroidia bacterium]